MLIVALMASAKLAAIRGTSMGLILTAKNGPHLDHYWQ